MLGLFGTLNLGTRSLQAQRTGVEVAGQNLANVNNPAYSRQRVQIQTSYALPTVIGSQGTGVEAVAIQQIRDALLDSQVRAESSVVGYWSATQFALQYAQTGLGEYIDSTGAVVSANGTTHGLADGLSSLFNAFQSVATAPESITERQLLLSQAQTLATRFNQTASGLNDVRNLLNTSLDDHVSGANDLLSQIADLNEQIASAEGSSGGTANDLRDLRQQKLEELSDLVDIQTSQGNNGAINVSIGGTQLISDNQQLDTLETYDAGGGQMLVRTVTGGTALTLTGGRMQGVIDARDGALATLQTNLDTLASQLITQVNTVHSAGFGLGGTTGADFFTGTDAASMGVNAALVSDPSLIQAAGAAGAPGDNTVALALAQLATAPQAGLGNQTFSDAYIQAVAGLGYSLSDANTQVDNSARVQAMMLQQRDSVSGVSVDEEMSDLIRYQKAYEASAKLVTTVDEMLDTILNMKR
jgi:flagellar hook-associated protein 1 FlgK